LINTRFGQRTAQGIFVKDVNGLKNTITLWNKHVDSLENGHVYMFSNMMTEGFPTAKPHFLATTRTTTIEEAPANLVVNFDGIELVDGTAAGSFVGFQNVYSYESCEHCKCRIRDDGAANQCHKCKRTIEVKYQDFMFSLVIETNDEFKSFTGFKRILNVHVANSQDDKIEMELNEMYAGRFVTINYMKRISESGEDCVIDSLEFD
jgi:hypothetical protein